MYEHGGSLIFFKVSAMVDPKQLPVIYQLIEYGSVADWNMLETFVVQFPIQRIETQKNHGNPQNTLCNPLWGRNPHVGNSYVLGMLSIEQSQWIKIESCSS